MRSIGALDVSCEPEIKDGAVAEGGGPRELSIQLQPAAKEEEGGYPDRGEYLVDQSEPESRIGKEPSEAGIEPITWGLDDECPILNAAHESGAVDKIHGASSEIAGDEDKQPEEDCLPNIQRLGSDLSCGLCHCFPISSNNAEIDGPWLLSPDRHCAVGLYTTFCFAISWEEKFTGT